MEKSNRTVLVTGGSGYIGSHVIVELLNNDYEVIAIDNFSNSYAGKDRSMPESLRKVQCLSQKSLKFYEADILNLEELEEIFSKHSFACVSHFAALKSFPESCKAPCKYYKNNVTGTLNLLKVMDKYHVRKIIFTSSPTVYGDVMFLPITEDHPVGIECKNPYSRSKYFVEEILKDLYKANSDWKVIILRPFVIAGAHESGEIGEDIGISNNLISHVSQVAIGAKDNFEVYGNDYSTPDGTVVRDYLHVMDLATGHIAALKRFYQEDFNGCETYNLGTGKGFPILKVIQDFELVSKVKIPYTIVGRRVGDVEILISNPSLAEKHLKWKASYPLLKICEDTWRWQKKNPKGYQETSV